MIRLATSAVIALPRLAVASRASVEHDHQSGGTVDVPGVGEVPEIAVWLGAAVLGLIVLGLGYSLISFILREPCPRCGSKNLRYSGATSGRNRSRRCLHCGWTNE